jgi:hypothetical protein
MSDIAEKLIINGNIKPQIKDDLAYLLTQFKINNPEKKINHAKTVVETALVEDYGFDLSELDIELSESINFIRLEVNKKSDKIA